MLHIIKKTLLNKKLILLFAFVFFSCQKEEEVKAIVYKKGIVVNTFYGRFYSTKRGGLNYYIPNQKERSKIFNLKDIDSISFNIDKQHYVTEPIIDVSYTRQINNSDFSFFIDKEGHRIIVDTIDDKATFLLFSSKKDVKELKEKKIIKFTMIDEKSK